MAKKWLLNPVTTSQSEGQMASLARTHMAILAGPFGKHYTGLQQAWLAASWLSVESEILWPLEVRRGGGHFKKKTPLDSHISLQCTHLRDIATIMACLAVLAT